MQQEGPAAAKSCTQKETSREAAGRRGPPLNGVPHPGHRRMRNGNPAITYKTKVPSEKSPRGFLFFLFIFFGRMLAYNSFRMASP